jgi:hypothetical protein
MATQSKHIRTQLGQVILAGQDGFAGLPAFAHVIADAFAPLARVQPAPQPREHCLLSGVPAHAAVVNLPAGVPEGAAGPALHPAAGPRDVTIILHSLGVYTFYNDDYFTNMSSSLRLSLQPHHMAYNDTYTKSIRTHVGQEPPVTVGFLLLPAVLHVQAVGAVVPGLMT